MQCFLIFVFIILKNSYLNESVKPVPFSAEYLICRPVQTDGQTDRQTDKLIRVGLGNLRFVQVYHTYGNNLVD